MLVCGNVVQALGPGATVGRWPAWSSPVESAINCVEAWLADKENWDGQGDTLLRNRLNIRLVCDLPSKATMKRWKSGRCGGELGKYDPRFVAHTRGYLEHWQQFGHKGTVGDHTYPFNILLSEFKATGGDREQIRWLLSHHFLICRMTPKEHGLFAARGVGLKDKMPEGFRFDGDIRERPAAVGPELEVLPPQENWVTDLTEEELKKIYILV